MPDPRNKTDQYSIRRSQQNRAKIDPNEMTTAMELMGFSPELMQAALANAGDIYDQQNGPAPEFSPEDQQALAVLQGKVEQLQPVNAPAPIRSNTAGNPYALDLSGLSAGVQNLAASMVNAGRADELYGDPDKVDRFTSRAQDKIARAKQLREMAQSIPTTTGPSATGDPMNPAAREMLNDAQKLEDEAARELESADQARGVLGKAVDMERQQKEADQAKLDRESFINTFGKETYDQAMAGEREARNNASVTERERIRQNALTERALIDADRAYKVAKVQATAKATSSSRGRGSSAEGSNWPTMAQPSFVQEFIPTYSKPMKDRMKQLEGDDTIPSGILDGPITFETPEYYIPYIEEYQELKAKTQILDEIQLDAILYEQIQEDDYLPDVSTFTAPSDEQRQVLDYMKSSGLAPEMIEAYKYYNGISLTTAPKPESEKNPANNSFNAFFNSGVTGTPNPPTPADSTKSNNTP